jgi:hypothetical protein
VIYGPEWWGNNILLNLAVLGGLVLMNFEDAHARACVWKLKWEIRWEKVVLGQQHFHCSCTYSASTGLMVDQNQAGIIVLIDWE